MVLLIPAIVAVMKNVRGHYDRLLAEVGTHDPLNTENLRPAVVVVPFDDWTHAEGAAFRLDVSPEVVAVHGDTGEEPGCLKDWPHLVEEPARRAGLPAPRLEVVQSPYRFVMVPLLNFCNWNDSTLTGRSPWWFRTWWSAPGITGFCTISGANC